MNILRRIYPYLATAALVLAFLTAISILSGCGSAGIFRSVFTGVTAADAEFTGHKSGEVVSAAAAFNPEAGQLVSFLNLIGQQDPLAQHLGVLMPVSVVGETTPRWILCTGDYIEQCRKIKINGQVKFSGSAIGPGLIWKPSRLTSKDD